MSVCEGFPAGLSRGKQTQGKTFSGDLCGLLFYVTLCA